MVPWGRKEGRLGRKTHGGEFHPWKLQQPLARAGVKLEELKEELIMEELDQEDLKLEQATKFLQGF